MQTNSYPARACLPRDVSVTGATVINGTGTIFVDGNFALNGNLSYAGNSHISILVGGTMTINSSVTSMVGACYVHNSSGTATTIINGPITSWKGSLVTDTLTLNGGNSAQLSITKDPFFTSSQGKTMYIPGY